MKTEEMVSGLLWAWEMPSPLWLLLLLSRTEWELNPGILEAFAAW